jgi:outer membrane protein assembly factor BamB
VANGIVFTISNQCELYALAETTGVELWRSSLETDARDIFGSPVVDHGLLYAPSENAICVFLAGPVKKVVGRFEAYSAQIGTPEFAGKRMYVPGWDGVLAVRLPDEILRAQH